MSAKAICDVCSKEVKIETVPLGVALMPQDWLITVRSADNEMGLQTVDVCSRACADNFDKAEGDPLIEGTTPSTEN